MLIITIGLFFSCCFALGDRLFVQLMLLNTHTNINVLQSSNKYKVNGLQYKTMYIFSCFKLC